MSLPHDYDAIWLKAKSFVNHSFSALDSEDEVLGKFWAAIALELLAKAALCHINPLLIADPSDDGNSLLLAAGLPGDTRKFRSVTARTLFSRCARAFRTFDKDWALSITAERNAEIHSGASPYSEIVNHSRWWEQYWSGVDVLVVHQNRTLEDLVGPIRIGQVQDCLDKNKSNVNGRVESLMDAARQNLRLGAQDAPIAFDYGAFSGDAECPVCGHDGELHGEEVVDSERHPDYDWDDPWPMEIATIWADAFTCASCGLRLRNEAEIDAANLPDVFEIERDYEPDYDDFYGND